MQFTTLATNFLKQKKLSLKQTNKTRWELFVWENWSFWHKAAAGVCSSSRRLKEQISKKLEIENPHPIVPQALSQDLSPSLPLSLLSLSLPSLCVHLEEAGAGRLNLHICACNRTQASWETPVGSDWLSPGTVESPLSRYLLTCYLTCKKKSKQSGVGLVNIMDVSCARVYFTHAHLELQN